MTEEYEDVNALDDFIAEQSLIQRAFSLGHYTDFYGGEFNKLINRV